MSYFPMNGLLNRLILSKGWFDIKPTSQAKQQSHLSQRQQQSRSINSAKQKTEAIRDRVP